ncbi:unnamed protein product [Chrysodeixis includens]|uniref:C2H2-type domain-containing protein n=1 Tax=Chrysodeixis includens TaxID=689277 RepID=A0A9P0FV37_CHRIL|nr:unnamed protein product [Chrysodeixis includens]
MSDVKQVKVDNWGIYFLQRLKHFFNQTDYCDLTLQFQDNAQLKVHRLVLSACTEYFEILERTCEMYEDCLVMPDDLQADVVVPIVNFMYTGHLEFRMDLLERLYQTSQILNMPVLGKLLESHRNLAPKAPTPAHSYSAKRYTKHTESKSSKTSINTNESQKRSYSKAFDNNVVFREKKPYQSGSKSEKMLNSSYRAPSPSVDSGSGSSSQKAPIDDSRPTRYEIPEELDSDNVFNNSFCSISYASQPLMVHPETVKRYSSKRSGLFNDNSGSKKFLPGMSTVDIVECKRITKDDDIFDVSVPDHHLNDETEMFQSTFSEPVKDTNQLFDQILDNNESGPKVTIETKDNKAASNLDHAKIISEVLKKYPHLVKSNKNIKLKILDPATSKSKKHLKQTQISEEKPKVKNVDRGEPDYTYETDVLDSIQAAKLIALGAENVKGPWICLICGTPGKALHFPTYYKFRRHLVEVHNEKPVSNICEYCGLKSLKRNYLLHHLYSQHGVEPPPQYHFPKCNQCSYIALTEGFLVKHKLTHKDIKNFRCNVCPATFYSSSQLLTHIQNTGHKYSAERKTNNQCIYCLKVFLRESNLYAHIKTHHRKAAKVDCIIEDSDEERTDETPKVKSIKFEPSTSFEPEFEEADLQYPIQQKPVPDIPVVTRKQHKTTSATPNSNTRQKILNTSFDSPAKTPVKAKPNQSINKSREPVHNDLFQDIKVNSQEEEIVLIDDNEYIMKDHQLIPRKQKSVSNDFILADIVPSTVLQPVQQTSVQYTNVQNAHIEENVPQASMVIKKTANINQPIQIVVSNEEEYKALMASNHPIIFDNGDTNKTLTVLTAPHHDQVGTSGIDLDTTQSSDMMIIPEEYPLNVSEAVTSENSNIVVVYSHPVDQNKQYQIITTGGIGAQFVQSSAIITQNYETVTTSTALMNAHCLETQVEQTWQNNVESIDGQHIQMASETEIQTVHETQEGNIASVQTETDDNLAGLPQIDLVPNGPKLLCTQEITSVVTPSQSDNSIVLLDKPVDHQVLEKHQHLSPVKSETERDSSNVLSPCENISTSISSHAELVNTQVQIQEALPTLHTNNDNMNVVEEQVMPTKTVKEPIMRENVIQATTTESLLQALTSDDQVEPIAAEPIVEPLMSQSMDQQVVAETSVQPMETEIQTIDSEMRQIEEAEIETIETEIQTIETEIQQMETETVEEPTAADNVIQQTQTEMELASVLQNEVIPEQGTPIQPDTVVENTDNAPIRNMKTTEDHQDEIQSQAYDEIVRMTQSNKVEEFAKAEEKIQSLTSEWSEDEYDVVERNTSQPAQKLPNVALQEQAVLSEPEIEESIENIQEEMKKQLAAAAEPPDVGTEESASASASSVPEEETLSQELQLPPYSESPVNIVLPNPQAQQKISSLLNDWEDNDSQEEIVQETVPQTDTDSGDAGICLPTPEEPILPIVPLLKNDNIKSLVSDWDDDDEESKD